MLREATAPHSSGAKDSSFFACAGELQNHEMNVNLPIVNYESIIISFFGLPAFCNTLLI